jgi:hypothetical protein
MSSGSVASKIKVSAFFSELNRFVQLGAAAWGLSAHITGLLQYLVPKLEGNVAMTPIEIIIRIAKNRVPALPEPELRSSLAILFVL